MDNGSLDKYLFNEKEEMNEKSCIKLQLERLRVLHEECQQRIIHYDIKPENVLLDSDFSPKVADFGCHRNAPHYYHGIQGDSWLCGPRIHAEEFPCNKCDVHGFGILLLVGRRKNPNTGDTDGLDWFSKNVWDEYEKGALMALIEAYGIEEKDHDKAGKMSKVALLCVQDSPEARPPMTAVEKMLEGGVEIMPPSKPFQCLFAIGADVLNPPNNLGVIPNIQQLYWYKEKMTPIMEKYEIQLASS